MVIAATPIHVNTIGSRLIFQTTAKPSMKTKGSNDGVATHQMPSPLPSRPIMTSAIAAGLNICLFFIASRYFEAIAMIPVRIIIGKPLTSVTGDNTKNNMSAVIREDSRLAGICSIVEKT